MAPHSEWPQMMISDTFKENIENSMAAATLFSCVLQEQGGIKLPILRTTNKSPGSVDAKRLGTTRLSEHPIKSTSGFCPSASCAKRARLSSVRLFLNSTIP